MSLFPTQTDFLVQAKKSLSGDVYEEEPIEGDLSEIDEGLNLVVDYREAAGRACDPPSLRFNKDQIGEHTHKKNLDIFKSLLKSLEFTNLRIVESECFFQTWRLPLPADGKRDVRPQPVLGPCRSSLVLYL